LFSFSTIFDIKYRSNLLLNYTFFSSSAQEKNESYPQAKKFFYQSLFFKKILQLLD